MRGRGELEPGSAAVVSQAPREAIAVDKNAKAIQVLIGGLYCANLLLLLPEDISALQLAVACLIKTSTVGQIAAFLIATMPESFQMNT